MQTILELEFKTKVMKVKPSYDNRLEILIRRGIFLQFLTISPLFEFNVSTRAF